MSFEYSLEEVYQVWNDSTGERIEIGPDSDSLGLIEIRYRNEKGDLCSSIRMEEKQALLVYASLGKMLGKTSKKKEVF